MHRIVFCLLLAMSAAGVCLGGDIGQAEREHLLANLEKSREMVREATRNLTEAQWNFKAAPDRWSIADCVEHIAVSEDFLRGVIEKDVMGGTATPEKAAERKKYDEKVLPMVTDRSFKAKSPEPLTPNRRFGSPAEALKHFEKSRGETLAFARNTAGLRDFGSATPFGLELDAFQWTLFLSGHTMRHTAQILEVKAEPGFPK